MICKECNNICKNISNILKVCDDCNIDYYLNVDQNVFCIDYIFLLNNRTFCVVYFCKTNVLLINNYDKFSVKTNNPSKKLARDLLNKFMKISLLS